MVKASKESGNVWINFDVNCFGEVDSQPEKRPCPIGKDKLDIPLRAIFCARHGQDEPDQVQLGDLYVMFSGGKDRKRLFLKSLKTKGKAKSGTKLGKTYCRNIMLIVSESSWRARRLRARGHCKLTQSVYMVSCHQTFNGIPYVSFKTMAGSTKSDVMGPVDLDKTEDLPTMPLSKKKLYLGRRFVLVGGKPEESSESDDDDDDDAPVDEEDRVAEPAPTKPRDPPMSHHALPLKVATNMFDAYNVKHVVDLTPTPQTSLAFEVLSRGGSYVALCSTPAMAMYLKGKLFTQLVKAIVDPSQPLLHDPRFSSSAAVGLASPCSGVASFTN